jgi:peptidyl-prolyl cis-trans isomerase B (cyclophilin B)
VVSKKQRQRQLERERYQRRMNRRVEHESQVRKWSISALAGIVVLGLAVGGYFLFGAGTSKSPAAASATHSPSATASPSASASGASASPSSTAAAVTEPAHHCAYTSSPPAARKVGIPSATPDYKAAYQATIHTNRGNVVIDLLNSKATCTVNSFVYLAGKNYFNDTTCPRLSTSGGLYMLQCGDPTGTGTGGPGYVFTSENLTGATYTAGTLAMANTGAPDSNGSQFFMVYKDSSLAPSYTPFGHVVAGLKILQSIGAHGYGPPVSSAGGGKPKESVEIESVTVKKT